MDTYYQDKAKATDEELCHDHSCIEPEYTRANALVERVMVQFEAEQFKPLLKKVADAITEHLWDIFRDHIISDTEMNVAGHIRDRIESSIRALLAGEKWAIEKYCLGNYRQEEVREAIAKHIPQELQDKRLQELEAENKRLKEIIEWMRRN
jgi:hypothetical protein